MDLPVLLDDLLVHVPSQPLDLLSQHTSSPEAPHIHYSPPHPLARPRIEFEANVNDIMTRTTQGLFLGPFSPRIADTPIFPSSPPQSQGTLPTNSLHFLKHETPKSDEPTEPLPNLHDLRFRIHPTPRLARDLRGVRVYVPAVHWLREVVRDDKHRVAALSVVPQVA